MSKMEKIGTVASSTNKLTVLRQGEQISLGLGDAIFAGDVLQNKDQINIDVELPGMNAGQADSLMTLAPQSSAALNTITSGDQAVIEVSQITGGIELFATGQGNEGAILQNASGAEFSGLVGSSLLAAGSIGGAGTVAAAVGGAVGVAALTTASGDDINTTQNSFNDVRVDSPETNGEQPPGDSENPDTTENPDNVAEMPANPDTEMQAPEMPAPEEGTTGTVLDILLDPLADILGATPLAVVTDPLFDLLGALPLEAIPLISSIGSAPNPAQALPLDSITSNLPGQT